MACLLVLVVAAAVLTAPPGKLTHAARTTSPEAFWRAALPDSPMPESIRELLRPSAEVRAPSADADVRDDDPPPPMNFNYDDYRASPSPRNQVVATSSSKAPEHVGARRNAATGDENGARASPPAVFFLEDAVRVGGSLPFPRGLLLRAAPNEGEAAPAAHQPPVELYAVRSVRAVEGSSFVVCRGEARSDGAGTVHGCRGVGPARVYAVDVAGERGNAVAATVVCHADDDAPNGNLEHAASRLLGVRPGGAAVCYAVPDAQILLVKSEEVPSSA